MCLWNMHAPGSYTDRKRPKFQKSYVLDHSHPQVRIMSVSPDNRQTIQNPTCQSKFLRPKGIKTFHSLNRIINTCGSVDFARFGVPVGPSPPSPLKECRVAPLELDLLWRDSLLHSWGPGSLGLGGLVDWRIPVRKISTAVIKCINSWTLNFLCAKQAWWNYMYKVRSLCHNDLDLVVTIKDTSLR